MDILFLGDIVGRSGRKGIAEQLPKLRKTHHFDCIIANAENSAGGFGLTASVLNELEELGIDAFTMGNHTWDKKELMGFIHRKPHIVRPINYPEGSPGEGAYFIETPKGRILLINVLGRVFMDPMDCPFRAVDAFLKNIALKRDCDAIIVDMHAEATSEKQAMGYHLDGRASLVVGTHTHTPTADHRILPSRTGYLSDAGMCGDYDSVLGMDKGEPLKRFYTKIPNSRYEPATGEGTLSGVAIRTDAHTGLCLHIEAVRLGPHLERSVPKVVGIK